MYQRQEFKDREAKNPNKRRIIVLEQNANEIIANIEPVAEEIAEEGTPFNANLMEKFQESIIQSEADSSEALEKANQAIDAVKNGQGTSVYIGGAFVANFDADRKLEVSDYNVDKRNFDSQIENINETKANKTLVDSEFINIKNMISNLESRLSTIETSPNMTKIIYDESTNTFKM